MFTILDYHIKAVPFILGAALAFFGWTLYWLGINITGAAVGGTIGMGMGAGMALLFDRNEFLIPLVIIMGLLGAILGMILLRTIHKIVFFLTGFVLGVLAGGPVLQIMANASSFPTGRLEVEIGLKVACGLIAGVLLLLLNRYIVVLLTAAIGTFLLLYSWDYRNAAFAAPLIFFPALIFQTCLLTKKGRRFLVPRQRKD